MKSELILKSTLLVVLIVLLALMKSISPQTIRLEIILVILIILFTINVYHLVIQWKHKRSVVALYADLFLMILYVATISVTISATSNPSTQFVNSVEGLCWAIVLCELVTIGLNMIPTDSLPRGDSGIEIGSFSRSPFGVGDSYMF